MSNQYFSFFRKKYYGGELATDLTFRFRIRDFLKQKIAIFYTYNVKSGERADIIAEKLYGDAGLDWLIYLMNNVYDPYYDWAMSEYDWNKYMALKYGSVEASTQLSHHFEQIIQERTLLEDGNMSPEQVIEIDYDNYLAINDTLKRAVTCYEYEEKLNTQKGEIKLVDPIYIPQILEELRKISDAAR